MKSGLPPDYICDRLPNLQSLTAYVWLGGHIDSASAQSASSFPGITLQVAWMAGNTAHRELSLSRIVGIHAILRWAASGPPPPEERKENPATSILVRQLKVTDGQAVCS